jgi:hypothetical protein
MTLDIDRTSESIARLDNDDLRTMADVLPALKWSYPEGSDTRPPAETPLAEVIEAQEAYERG